MNLTNSLGLFRNSDFKKKIYIYFVSTECDNLLETDNNVFKYNSDRQKIWLPVNELADPPTAARVHEPIDLPTQKEKRLEEWQGVP